MRIKIQRWFLAILLLLATSELEGASLASMRLIPDGSINPPGDQILVSVSFSPADKKVDLEIRAFAYLEADRSKLVPVEAKGGAPRGPKNELLLTVSFERVGAEPIVSRRIPIPYSNLKLPLGRHRIGYEVRGIAGKRTQFNAATEMTVIVVSETTRKEIFLEEEIVRDVPMKKNVVATIDRNGKLETKMVEVESHRSQRETRHRRHEVNIPGEYSRPKSFATRGDDVPDPEQSPRAATLAPLEERPWAPLSEFEPQKLRTIYFATNRAVIDPANKTSARFGSTPGELVHGACIVDIPIETHVRGQLETPSWWQRRDPDRHFLIERLTTLAPEDFLSRTSPGDVLLFIHGYNTDFDYAVLRAAQLVHDLKFPGAGVAFSWPSTATTAGYLQDEENNAASVPSLAGMLEELASAPSPTRKIHVIVHSMGNRLFLKAAREFELAQKGKPPRKIFGNVVLAAPDVDAAAFSALLPSVLRLSTTATLYYCEYDRALLASQTLHQNKPVGLGQFFAEGLDTVNAENANTSFLGHGYFASEHPLLQDLSLLLFGKRPDGRLPPLRPAGKVFGYDLWSFQPP